MMSLRILDIIIKLSFIFSILTYMIPYNSLSNYSIIFVMSILTAFLGSYIKQKDGPYYLVGLLMLPFYFLFRCDGSIPFITLVIFFIYFFIIRHSDISTYGYYQDNFKRGFAIYIGMIVFSYFSMTISFLNNISGFFMIIYFVSYVIFIRSIRHMENNQDMELINKQNTIYSIVVLVMSILLTMDKVVNFLGYWIRWIYTFIVDLFIRLFYWLFIGAGYISMFMVDIFKKLFGNNQMPPEEAEKNAEDIWETAKNKKTIKIPPIILNIIDWVIRVLLILLVIYTIVRIFKRAAKREKVRDEYVEESEFIRANKDKQTKNKRFTLPKNNEEKIRYYFRKFMNKCNKEGVPIVEEDTTADINMKASNKYEGNTLDYLRDIYIPVRYGDKKVNKETVKEYKRKYKKI